MMKQPKKLDGTEGINIEYRGTFPAYQSSYMFNNSSTIEDIKSELEKHLDKFPLMNPDGTIHRLLIMKFIDQAYNSAITAAMEVVPEERINLWKDTGIDEEFRRRLESNDRAFNKCRKQVLDNLEKLKK